MSVTVQVKRGTQTQVLAGTLAIGEIAFATDTKNLFTFDGVTKQLIGKAGVDTLVNRPSFGVNGRLFFASDTGVLFIDTGSAWVTVLPFGTTTGTICEGNDTRLSNARMPVAHNLIDTTGHTATGLTTGQVITATGATTYGFGDIGSIVNGATAKTAPVDGDYLGLMDSESTPTANVLKKLSWAYVKSVLKTYFDGLYTLSNLGGVPTSRTVAGHALTNNVSVSASDVGLGNVTNDAQLKASQLGAASGAASLNTSTKVVEDPANATATPTASKIPIADVNGKLDTWVSDSGAATKGITQLSGDLGGSATAPTVVGIHSGATALAISTITDGQFLKRDGTNIVSGSATGISTGKAIAMSIVFS
jgi:hypothetical protein